MLVPYIMPFHCRIVSVVILFCSSIMSYPQALASSRRIGEVLREPLQPPFHTTPLRRSLLTDLPLRWIHAVDAAEG